MNERIQKLAEQATSIVESPLNREGWTSSYAYFDKEKFAEMIVKECANIDFRRKVGLTADDHYEISKVIKQHFGVEE
jgi:hypothetical protein